MKKLDGSPRLATTVLGLCGLVFASAGCDGNGSNDGSGSAGDATQGGTDDGSTDTDASGTGTDGGSDDSGDDGPPIEGLGCGVTPTCDKGTYEGNLNLTTESDIAEIEGYSAISGFLLIRGSDFTCLDFLACMETARGISLEDNEYLENVDGFHNITEVPYYITVSRNPVLEDLSGFDAVTTVSSNGDDVQLGPRGINIFDNDLIVDLAGFDALVEIEGDITISNNKNLVEISGFNAFDTLLDHPNADPEAGTMGKPVRLGGSLTISRNPVLERVSGFSSLIVIYKNLTIQYNDVLTRLTGLYDLAALGGAFIVTNNPELCTSEAYKVGGELEQGPGPGSSTANNKDC